MTERRCFTEAAPLIYASWNLASRRVGATPVLVFTWRRWDDAAERARHGIARIVGHDQKNVGRAIGRDHARRPIGQRLRRCFADLAAERYGWRRQLLPVNGDRGRGRARPSNMSRPTPMGRWKSKWGA